jgi:hypothetical protein
MGRPGRFRREATIRRLLVWVDPDRLDTVLGGFVQRLAAGVAQAERRRVLAVDGKTVRGSRHLERDGTEAPCRHLLAVIDHDSRVMLGQTAVESKTSEIGRFTPFCRPPIQTERR